MTNRYARKDTELSSKLCRVELKLLNFLRNVCWMFLGMLYVESMTLLLQLFFISLMSYVINFIFFLK
jgi:hypothetical protein